MNLTPFSLLLIASLPFGLAQAEDAKPVQQIVHLIRMENLIVRVPEVAALDLRPALIDPTQAKAAHAKLLKMIRSKEAELVDWPVLTTRSGNRAVSENIKEVRFPIEFAPPQTLTAPVAYGYVTFDAPTLPKPGVPTVGGTTEPPAGTSVQIQTLAGVPTTFETRNVGVTLEVEPVVAQGNPDLIEMQGSVGRQTFAGFRRSMSESAGVKVSVETPEFEGTKISATTTAKSGVPTLIGFAKVPGKEGIIELSVLTATVVEGGRYPIPPDWTPSR
jgi:hypothetical protein